MNFALRTIQTAIAIFVFAILTGGQDTSPELPNKILGYRLHRTNLKVAVKNPKEPTPAGEFDVVIIVDEPRIVSVGITGARAEIMGEIESFRHEGEIDFVKFRDFTVNGVPVKISELTEKFPLKKKRAFKLTKPIVVEIGSVSMVRAAAADVIRSAPGLRVTGTVLVFGRFKRLGIEFKRVIPVPVAFSIENTLFD